MERFRDSEFAGWIDAANVQTTYHGEQVEIKITLYDEIVSEDEYQRSNTTADYAITLTKEDALRFAQKVIDLATEGRGSTAIYIEENEKPHKVIDNGDLEPEETMERIDEQFNNIRRSIRRLMGYNSKPQQ